MICSALGAGAVSALLYGPVEMTTIHQQKTGLVTPLTPTLALTLAITLDPDPDPNPNPNSNQSPLGTISHLTRTYGTACLWRGVVPTAWREAIYTAGYLPCRKQARCGHKLSRCGRTARIADDQGGGLAEAGRAAWAALGMLWR